MGFNSADAFVIVDGRQLMVGTIVKDHYDKFMFEPYDFCMEHYVKRRGYLTAKQVPTGEQIIADYEKQLAERGILVNNEIKYAG